VIDGKPKMAVVGTGWWSTEFHIPSLIDYPECELVALVDPNEEKRRKAEELFGIKYGFSSVEEMCAAMKVDGAIVATPSAYHYPIAKYLMSQGVHVMVEKPFTTIASDAFDLVRQAEEFKLQLTIGYTFQHTHAAKTLVKALHNEEIGEVLLVNGLFASMAEAYYRGQPELYKDAFKWAITGPDPETFSDPKIAGGGQGQTQTSHALGLVLYALNQRVTSVAAFMNNTDLSVDLVDAYAFTCTKNTIGNMGSTGNLRVGDQHQQEFRYYGSRGYLLHNMRAGELLLRTSTGREFEITGSDAGDAYPARAPSRHLVDLISGAATENFAPALPGAWAVEFLQAAYKSAASGKIEKVPQ
jgi:predicted dehydrogenase